MGRLGWRPRALIIGVPWLRNPQRQSRLLRLCLWRILLWRNGVAVVFATCEIRTTKLRTIYVRLPSIAKELTAGYMLCISSIGKMRVLLKIFQAMLTLCSQHTMSLQLDSRLQIVRTLYRIILKGTINAGDVGEIVCCSDFVGVPLTEHCPKELLYQ